MDMLPRKSLRRQNSGNNIPISLNVGQQYENSYALNVQKSLKKKLECTKRSVITYNKTLGGITAQYDAVSFELLLFACGQYYTEKNDYVLIKTTATDNKGKHCQYTFRINKCSTGEHMYTINAYLPKCSLLVNGTQLELFTVDVEKMHLIMAKTKIDGAKINVDLLNEKLAQHLATALEMLDAPKQHDQESLTNVQEDTIAQCIKCKRNSKTRSILCTKGEHWIHYVCEKLTEDEIKFHNDNPQAPYVCKMCKSIQPHTQAAILLREERICNGCDDQQNEVENMCIDCSQPYHTNCLDSETEKCYTCIGHDEQENEIRETESETAQTLVKICDPPVTNEVQIQEQHSNDDMSLTSVKSPRQNMSYDNNEVAEGLTSITIEKDRQPAPKVGYTNTSKNKSSINKNCNNKNEGINNTSDMESQEINVRMKELRQLEQKLKKREEQIKIKEAMVQEDLKEKVKIMERLHKAEIHNIELENTIKTLHTRIEMLQMQTTNSNSGPTSNNKQPLDETDELVVGMRKRVTRYVLNRIDDELDKLENQHRDPTRYSVPNNAEKTQEPMHNTHIHVTQQSKQANVEESGTYQQYPNPNIIYQERGADKSVTRETTFQSRSSNVSTNNHNTHVPNQPRRLIHDQPRDDSQKLYRNRNNVGYVKNIPYQTQVHCMRNETNATKTNDYQHGILHLDNQSNERSDKEGYPLYYNERARFLYQDGHPPQRM